MGKRGADLRPAPTPCPPPPILGEGELRRRRFLGSALLMESEGIDG
jgi:hypothetical protein